MVLLERDPTKNVVSRSREMVTSAITPITKALRTSLLREGVESPIVNGVIAAFKAFYYINVEGMDTASQREHQTDLAEREMKGKGLDPKTRKTCWANGANAFMQFEQNEREIPAEWLAPKGKK